MAAIFPPHAGRYQSTGAARNRAEQIRSDGAIARRLQEEEIAASNVPFEPPVVPSDVASDEESTPTPPTRHVDANGAFSPEPYHRRFPRRQSVPPVLDANGAYTPPPYHRPVVPVVTQRPRQSVPPVVPHEPVLDANGAYTPSPYHRPAVTQRPRQSAPPVVPRDLDANGAYTPSPYHRPPVTQRPRQPAPPAVPPVVPSDPTPFIPPRPRQPAPVIPPVVPSPPRARDRNVTFEEPPRPQPRAVPPPPPPLIPPFPPPHSFPSARRATTPRPSPTYWYPAGVVPPHLCAPTPVPVLYPPGAVVPAPPIPPIVRPPMASVVYSPAQKKEEDVVVPFVPPVLDEKKTVKVVPKPILKPKPKHRTVEKPGRVDEPERGRTRTKELRELKVKHKAPVCDETQSRERTKAPKVKPKPLPKASESSETEGEPGRQRTPKPKPAEESKPVNDDSSPLHELSKHVNLLTGSFKCTTCAAEIHPKPIHKDPSTPHGTLPAFDTHLHLACAACSTTYCRGCRRPPACKRTCTAEPNAKCHLRTCCRAGRAVAVFLVLSAFDAHFLALARAHAYTHAHAGARRPSYFDYIKHSLSPPSSSPSSPLSTLLESTITTLLPWLPPAPHIHASVEPLLRVSLLLDVVRAYLRAPRDAWVRPAHARAYVQMLVMLLRLEEAGRGVLRGLVFVRRRGVERTRGVGRVVWALAGAGGKGEEGGNVGWAVGAEHDSFAEILSRGGLERELEGMREREREEGEERRALLDWVLCQVVRWRMAHVLE